MRIISAFTMSALLFSLSLPVHAGTHPQPQHGTAIVGRTAEVSVSTLTGCDDIVTDVTVKDGIVDLGSPAASHVDVFFVSNNICDIGSSTSFAGSVPLLPGDFTQTGTESATFEKTFNVAGHDLHLTLAWTGTGAVSVDPVTGKSSRASTVSGNFVIDGLDQISGDSIIQGGLTITQTASKGRSCKGNVQKEKLLKKEKMSRQAGSPDHRR